MMKRIIYTMGLSLIMALSACTDWLTVQPETSMTAETLFQTDNGVKYGLNGAYMLASKNVYSPSGYFVGGGGFGIVENMANTYLYVINTDGYNWANHIYEQTDSQKNVNEYTFLSPYTIIANLNSLLKEMELHRDKISPEVYHMVRGEAFALRACCHFDLLRIYGPVPSKADAGKTYLPYVRVNDAGNYEYHTFAQFMEYVQADLDSAEFLLSKYDPVLTTNISYTESTSYVWPYRKSRINYYGVLGLQARVALWIGQKEKALRYAKLVKDAKDSAAQLQFRLTTPDDDVNSFYTTDLSHYSEHICGVKCETFDFMDSAWGPRRLSATNDPDFGRVLYGEKYADDLRYQHFWRTGAGTWYAPDGSILPEYKVESITINKFSQFITSPTNNCKDNFPIMRLPEIYFIIMECGTLDEANTLYQEYCTARNIEYVPLTEEDRQERIMLESIREYVGEGQNFFTYKRNNVRRMIGAQTDCSENQYIVPIPEAEYLDIK